MGVTFVFEKYDGRKEYIPRTVLVSYIDDGMLKTPNGHLFFSPTFGHKHTPEIISESVKFRWLVLAVVASMKIEREDGSLSFRT